MQLNLSLNPRKIAIALGTIAVLFALQSLYAEFVLSQYLGMDADTAPARLLDLFSVNLEESLPTWYSTLNLFIAASLLGWIATVKHLQRDSAALAWSGLAIIFLYLSMDEGSSIHEATSGPLQRAFNTTGFFEFGWLLLGIPLVLVFGLLYFRFWLRLPTPTRPLFALAGILYVGGAIVIEGISANQYALDGGASFTYMAIATLEELGEMLGVIVLIYALLDYMQRNAYSVIFQTVPGLVGTSLRWAVSPRRMALAFAISIIVVNAGLLWWGLALREEVPVTPVTTGSAPDHYAVLVEEVAGENVIITHFSGVFTPADSGSQRTVAALLTSFAAVQVLSLPDQNATIVLAGDTPVLNAERIISLMEAMQETNYVFYDAPIVQALVSPS